MNLLQRLFRETFNATNPPKWAYGFEHEIVIDNPRPYFTGVPMSNEERLLFPGSFEVIHTSIANQRFFDETKEMSNDEELRTLCLKLICHGQYHQDDIIHLRVDEGLTGGWALTYDSICAGGVFGNFRKAYRNIGDVDDCIASLVFSNRACFSVSDLQPIIMSNPSIASLKNFLMGAQKLCSYDDYS